MYKLQLGIRVWVCISMNSEKNTSLFTSSTKTISKLYFNKLDTFFLEDGKITFPTPFLSPGKMLLDTSACGPGLTRTKGPRLSLYLYRPNV